MNMFARTLGLVNEVIDGYFLLLSKILWFIKMHTLKFCISGCFYGDLIFNHLLFRQQFAGKKIIFPHFPRDSSFRDCWI